MGRLQSLFPSHQLDVIIGSLLGDARLECRSIGVRSPVTARFRVHHGEKQKEYVLWKYEILRDLVSKEPKEISWTNPKRGLHEVSWYFHTRSLKEFGELHSFFYRDSVKILPNQIFDLLNPRMIAVWFMDDGSNNGDGLTINTHSFPKEDQEKITRFFLRKFAIKATIVKDRSQWKLAIGANGFRDFISLIKPFVAPSMIYKIASPRNDLLEFRAEREISFLANTSVPREESSEKV